MAHMCEIERPQRFSLSRVFDIHRFAQIQPLQVRSIDSTIAGTTGEISRRWFAIDGEKCCAEDFVTANNLFDASLQDCCDQADLKPELRSGH